MKDPGKMAAFVKAFDEIEKHRHAGFVVETLTENCFVPMRINFINIVIAVVLIIENGVPGGKPKSLYGMTSARVCGRNTPKAIERSIRSAVCGAWARAKRQEPNSGATLFNGLTERPKAMAFLKAVAACAEKRYEETCGSDGNGQNF